MTLSLAATSETITVTGQQPVVDRTNVSANTQLSTKEFEKAPVGRSYQSIVLFSPGVALAPGANPNPQVHGSNSTTNVFLFDGVDSTDTTTGTFGSNITSTPSESVFRRRHVGEYGRAQGGHHVITSRADQSRTGKCSLSNDRGTHRHT